MERKGRTEGAGTQGLGREEISAGTEERERRERLFHLLISTTVEDDPHRKVRKL